MKAIAVGILLGFSVLAEATIFGKDDRKFNPSIEMPYSPVGKINDCTGVLVDRDLVLTVRHCVIDYHTGEIIKAEWAKNIFHPGAAGGRSMDPTRVKHIHWLGTDKQLWGENNTDQDWAILELEDPIGDEYGWMEIKPITKLTEEVLGGRSGHEKPMYSMASYSWDRGKGNNLVVQEPRNGVGGCAFYDERDLFDTEAHQRSHALHDCDSGPGASGAPIYKMEIDPKDGKLKPFIYAMEVGAFAEEGQAGDAFNVPMRPDISKERSMSFINRAAKPTFFYAKFRLLQKNREQERRYPTRFETDYFNNPANFPEWLYKEMSLKPAPRNEDGTLVNDPERLVELGRDPYHEKRRRKPTDQPKVTRNGIKREEEK